MSSSLNGLFSLPAISLAFWHCLLHCLLIHRRCSVFITHLISLRVRPHPQPRPYGSCNSFSLTFVFHLSVLSDPCCTSTLRYTTPVILRLALLAREPSNLVPSTLFCDLTLFVFFSLLSSFICFLLNGRVVSNSYHDTQGDVYRLLIS